MQMYSWSPGLVGLFVVVPFCRGRLGWHESILLALMTALTSVSYAGMGIVKELWPDFYLVSLLGMIKVDF